MRKRENLRKAFHQFDYRKVALYKESKIKELMKDSGLIRNKHKIEATINNAQCVLELEKRGDSFSDYLWSFVNHKTLQNNYEKLNLVPAKTALSIIVSKALKKHGFKFVGPKIIYSHMQASGLVNDHLNICFRHKELKGQIIF